MDLCKYKLNLIKIEDIQNISLFIIACSTFFSHLHYNLAPIWYGTNEVINYYDNLLPFIGVYAFVDFFVSDKYDAKIHHICIIGLLFYNNYFNITPEDKFIFSYTLLKTEISSIFYVLKYWLPKKTILYDINGILFFLSFFKLRIYDFYYKIIYNISFYNAMQKYSKSNYYMSSILLISCYGLFILNLYWFVIMNKILYKKITKKL